MQSLERKKFVLYFNPEFAGGERIQIVGTEFFNHENGFRRHNKEDIRKMEIDAVLNVGPLKVVRVN